MKADSAGMEALKSQLEALEIAVPVFPEVILIKKACLYHNQRQAEKNRQLEDIFSHPPALHAKSPRRQLEQAMVSYLIYRCQEKYPILQGLQGHRAMYEVYVLARAKILNCIAKEYAWLQAECERQNYL